MRYYTQVMSIGEGDPYTSAYSSAEILKEVVTRKRDPFPQPWLVELNEKFSLDLSLEVANVQREDIAGKLWGVLAAQIDARKIDFWALQPYCEEALHVPEERRLAFRLRLQEVQSALEKWTVKAASTVAIECGTEVFSDPRNKAPIREVFKIARTKALQEVGVLTPEGDIVPGQEKFVPAGFVPRPASGEAPPACQEDPAVVK